MSQCLLFFHMLPQQCTQITSNHNKSHQMTPNKNENKTNTCVQEADDATSISTDTAFEPSETEAKADKQQDSQTVVKFDNSLTAN